MTDEMMQAMQVSMTPGEHHEKLKPMTGTFQVESTMWMDSSSSPVTGTGISENRWVLGNRFLEQRLTGSFMDMPFEAIGYMGYENIQKKYVSSWMDSMGTGIMPAEGVLKPDNSIEFLAQYPDAISGKMMKFKEILRIHSQDHYSLEMYITGEDGSEFKNMEAHYRRQK
jgi:hypothetical protein